jgi:hypothetical protein
VLTARAGALASGVSLLVVGAIAVFGTEIAADVAIRLF